MEVHLADSIHERPVQLVMVKHGMTPHKDSSVEVAVRLMTMHCTCRSDIHDMHSAMHAVYIDFLFLTGTRLSFLQGSIGKGTNIPQVMMPK